MASCNGDENLWVSYDTMRFENPCTYTVKKDKVVPLHDMKAYEYTGVLISP